MAVALSNGVAGSPANGSSRTFSYTVNSNANRALLAQVFSATAAITAITYAGVSLTLLDSYTNLYLYGLAAPASGANNISYTLNMYETSAVTLANFDDVNQSTPFGSVTRNTGSNAAPQSSSLTVPANGMLYAAGRHSYSGGAAFAGSGTTLAGAEFSSGASRFGGYRTTTGAVTFSTSGSNSWHMQTVPINAAGGGGDTTAPVLTSPTGTQTGSSTATGTVTTDEANGSLFFLASTNATESAATVKAAGSQAVTGAGVQNVTFGGLSPSTAYYAHYVHRDAAGNDSSRVSSASFTTSAAGVPNVSLYYHLLIGASHA